jgi:hypothetical protein
MEEINKEILHTSNITGRSECQVFYTYELHYGGN